MTPALLQTTGAARVQAKPDGAQSAQEQPEERSEIVRQAFQQGAEHATAKLMQQQASVVSGGLEIVRRFTGGERRKCSLPPRAPLPHILLHRPARASRIHHLI